MCPINNECSKSGDKPNGRCWAHRGKQYANVVVEVVAPAAETPVEVAAPVAEEQIINSLISVDEVKETNIQTKNMSPNELSEKALFHRQKMLEFMPYDDDELIPVEEDPIEESAKKYASSAKAGVAPKAQSPIKSNAFFESILDIEKKTIKTNNLLTLDSSINFKESFDRNKLAFILQNKDRVEDLFREDARNKVSLDKYYNSSSNDGILNVKYAQTEYAINKQKRANVLCGRYHAAGSVSGQGMVREVRHTIFDDYYVDLDVDNCHPVIILHLCDWLGFKCDTLREYIVNREGVIKELIDLNNGMTRDQVKKIFLTINNNGTRDYNNITKKSDFIVKYFNEMKSVRANIVARFSALKKISDTIKIEKNEDFNLMGAAMSHLCCFIENQILMTMLNYLKSKMDDISGSILCFDGIMIRKDKFNESWIKDLEDLFVEMGLNLKFSIKAMKPIDLISMGFDNSIDYQLALPKKTKIDLEETQLDEAFDKTFCSELVNNELNYILKHMGKTFDEFKSAICDKKYMEGIELSFWAKEHCTIINHAYNDFSLDYRFFENILKTIKFYKGEIANRFIAYFIHEFFVFGSRSEDCFERAKICDSNHLSIRDYTVSEFSNISISIKSKIGFSYNKLSDLLKSIPFHKFTNSCYIWGHNPNDMDAFSKAIPFQSKVLDEDIKESDLLPDWLYYMKDIICNKDEDSWVWFRSYLANIIHQPNERTEVMVLLYSMETRLGKSTLKYWIDQVFGLANVSKVESITDAFGERGGPTLVGKKVVWFEELTDKKSTFRACMDRMKTAITEKRTTYKKLYHNLNETDNTNEYIAATNHLVGVLENRHTVLNVNAERQNDRAFYTKLRAGLTTHEINKTITYLKNFTTSLPMAILETRAYKSMLTNSNESITQFIIDIKSTECGINSHTTEKAGGNNYMYVKRDDLYRTYQTWCEKRGETILPMSRFKEKLSHYDGSIIYKKVKVASSSFFAFILPLDYFVPIEATE